MESPRDDRADAGLAMGVTAALVAAVVLWLLLLLAVMGDDVVHG